MRGTIQGIVVDTKDLPGIGIWQTGYAPTDPRYQRVMLYAGGPLGVVLWVRTGPHFGSWNGLVLLPKNQWRAWHQATLHWDRRKSIRGVLRTLGGQECDAPVRQGA